MDQMIRKLKRSPLLRPLRRCYVRWRLGSGEKPLSYRFGLDQGMPIVHYYTDEFLTEFQGSIQGRCLEFQEDSYATRFGKGGVTQLDILHHDDSNPQATIVADLTKANSLPDNTYDCIVCTYVLNMIFDIQKAIADLHRILKPGGVLLVTVPHFAMYSPKLEPFWRLTPHCLSVSLSNVFGEDNITLRSYGNSLTAAAQIRGVAMEELPERLLRQHDECFPVAVGAMVIKKV